ncbi:MAG: hypothetical protein NC299_12625 [Lachnospiraceae bacterium]|nr:hypothetical protein [Ruminococcus sp.]MCM1276185.1 hypothetical protein [Lachnospiraceae bacterium]
MENLYRLMDVLTDSLQELDTIKGGQLKMGELEAIDKITHSMKSTLSVLEDCGYSQAGNGGYNGNSYNGGNSYNDGNSYANRGEHFVRGHFSRNGGMSGARRNNRGRYSGGSGREHLIEELHEAMNEAESERERSAIRRCIEQLESD